MTKEEILKYIFLCISYKHNNDISPYITKSACEKENLLFENAIEFLDKLEKENADLEAQIEKMKLCQNCKFEDNDFMEEPCSACTRCLGEDIKREGDSDKWEIKEK